MNEVRIKSVLRTMNSVGDQRKESWFADQGLTDKDLSEAVKKGYLYHYDKDPKDFMSNSRYELTTAGRDYAWS